MGSSRHWGRGAIGGGHVTREMVLLCSPASGSQGPWLTGSVLAHPGGSRPSPPLPHPVVRQPHGVRMLGRMGARGRQTPEGIPPPASGPLPSPGFRPSHCKGGFSSSAAGAACPPASLRSVCLFLQKSSLCRFFCPRLLPANHSRLCFRPGGSWGMSRWAVTQPCEPSMRSEPGQGGGAGTAQESRMRLSRGRSRPPRCKVQTPTDVATPISHKEHGPRATSRVAKKLGVGQGDGTQTGAGGDGPRDGGWEKRG